MYIYLFLHLAGLLKERDLYHLMLLMTGPAHFSIDKADASLIDATTVVVVADERLQWVLARGVLGRYVRTYMYTYGLSSLFGVDSTEDWWLSWRRRMVDGG